MNPGLYGCPNIRTGSFQLLEAWNHRDNRDTRSFRSRLVRPSRRIFRSQDNNADLRFQEFKKKYGTINKFAILTKLNHCLTTKHAFEFTGVCRGRVVDVSSFASTFVFLTSKGKIEVGTHLRVVTFVGVRIWGVNHII